MRRILFGLLGLSFGFGCIHGGYYAQERDDRVTRELARQDRWAQQALDARPNRDQLETIRSGDYGSVGAARKELQKLFMAVDRATWIRDTSAELMRDEPDPQLSSEFTRAGRLRGDAIQAADELADALAEARGGLTIVDLKPGFDALRKAQASEDRLSRMVGPQLKLTAAPLPTPRPFIDAAARCVDANPELRSELDRLPGDDQTRIRARLADLDRSKEEQKRATPPPASADVAPPPPPSGAGSGSGVTPSNEPPPTEAEAPSPTLKIAGDAAELLGKKAPKSITLREDGLFALSYDDGDYLVDPNGKLVRKEAPQH